MTLLDLLRLVLANLNRMRTRVALTAIGVIIGTAAIIVLISLGVGLQTSTRSLFEMGDLTLIDVNAFGGFGPFGSTEADTGDQPALDDDALADIRALPHVVVVTPQQGMMGMSELKLGRRVSSVYIQGILPEAADAMGWELESGTPRLARGQIIIGPSAFDDDGGMMMFGPGMAMRAGGPRGRDAESPAGSTASPTDLMGRTLTLVLTKYDDENNEITRTERFRVAGVFAEGNHNYEAYISLAQLEELNRWFTGERRRSSDGYDRVVVKVDDPDHVLDTQAAIDAMRFSTSSQQQFLRELNRSFLVIQGVLGGVGAIALLVAAFGIANTMTMAIYERTKEIGIMKAIGATNNDVLKVFLAEAAAIGLIGGILGVAVGWGTGQVIDVLAQTYLMNDAAAEGDPASVVVTPAWLMLFALVFATLVGVTSGVYPALRAANMNPLRALRNE